MGAPSPRNDAHLIEIAAAKAEIEAAAAAIRRASGILMTRGVDTRLSSWLVGSPGSVGAVSPQGRLHVAFVDGRP